jgi:hypothetical protein
MRQDRFKRNGGVYKCQTFGTLHFALASIKDLADELIIGPSHNLDTHL